MKYFGSGAGGPESLHGKVSHNFSMSSILNVLIGRGVGEIWKTTSSEFSSNSVYVIDTVHYYHCSFPNNSILSQEMDNFLANGSFFDPKCVMLETSI